ncbi:MAG: dihydroneopterin aldolase [Gloeobacterales cyanobacterium]
MTEDRIYIKRLPCWGYVGSLAPERELGRVFYLDLELWVDTKQAAQHDDLSKTVDYGKLAVEVQKKVRESYFLLLETLADHLARFILHDPLVLKVRLSITKPQLPIPDCYGEACVEILRTREDYPKGIA